MAKKKKMDYVIGLITGRFETVRKGDKLEQHFVPMVSNPNDSITSIMKKDTEISRQSVLEKEGLIQPPLIINRGEFVKSEYEKDMLKRMKSIHN